MARIRTFIAVDIGEAVRQRAALLQERLGRSASNVKWVEEPKKFEWTRGDYVYVPPFTLHQHFANAGEECRIIVMSNRIVKDMGFDWYDQVEHAPGF